MSISTAEQQKQWYQRAFELFENTLNGESREPVHGLRRSAFAEFLAAGFPSTRQEEWRFTNVSPIAKTPFQPVLSYDPNGVTAEHVHAHSFGGHVGSRLVFIDGRFAQEHSVIGKLPDGVILESLASAMKTHRDLVEGHLGRQASSKENPFLALNTAFVRDGAFLLFPPDVVLEEPVHLLFLSTWRPEPFAVHPRNLIILGERSKASLVETYTATGEGTYLMNIATEIALGDCAVLEHDTLQNENEKSYHVKTLHVRQGRESSYTSNSINLGGSIVRNTVAAEFAGERALAMLNGLSLGTGSQLIDNHTVIDHALPNCESHELYKSILDGKSHGVFNGKIFVRKDAQKTDAKQTNKTLLLSDEATIDTKPQLEIFADDVKCTHGATVGQLDPEQVFYLRSRGIGLDTARDILTVAFADDVVQRITIEPLKHQLESFVHEKLGRGRWLRREQNA
jgi:Fe-S cluster assembly protein SufD